MWHWLNDWLGWQPPESWRLRQIRKSVQSVRWVVVHHQEAYETPALPWLSDQGRLEVYLALRRLERKDFFLLLPGEGPLPCAALEPIEGGVSRLVFPVHRPPRPCEAELCWRQHVLFRIPVRVLTMSGLLASLEVSQGAMYGTICGKNVYARRFPIGQLEGLCVAARVRSPYPLVLADAVRLTVCLVSGDDAEELVRQSPISLNLLQRQSTESLIVQSIDVTGLPAGRYRLELRAAGGVLWAEELYLMDAASWLEEIRCVHQCFVSLEEGWIAKELREVPAGVDFGPYAPCFVLRAARWTAGQVGVRLMALVGNDAPQELLVDRIVITDAPTPYVPDLPTRLPMRDMTGFELRVAGRTLAQLLFSPAPRAKLNAEGGFRPPPYFEWNEAAERQLYERLAQLHHPGLSPDPEGQARH